MVYDGPIFKNSVDLKFGTEIIPVGEKWAQIDVSIKLNDQLTLETSKKIFPAIKNSIQRVL